MKRTILPSIAAMIFAVAVAGAQVPPMPQSPTTPQAHHRPCQLPRRLRSLALRIVEHPQKAAPPWLTSS